MVQKTQVGQIEKKTQERLINLFQNKLDYTYLGNYETRVFNSNVEEELKLILPEIVTKWENRIGVKANEHKVKKMKTKWGTCNHKDKRIWLNIELIKKPLIHLEYVVLHELVHLIEKTHNEVFLFHMDNHMPQWRVHKDELNSLSLAYQDWNE